MGIDLDDIERKALAATPELWKALPPSHGIDLNWHVTNDADTFVIHCYGFAHAVDESSKSKADFIAAANPAVVLALVRRLREAEHDLQVTETQCLDGIQAQNELHEEILQLRADAERYHLLKRGQHWSTVNGVGDTLRGEALDQAIDAKQTQQAKTGD